LGGLARVKKPLKDETARENTQGSASAVEKIAFRLKAKSRHSERGLCLVTRATSRQVSSQPLTRHGLGTPRGGLRRDPFRNDDT
jgi:hypothetical protein